MLCHPPPDAHHTRSRKISPVAATARTFPSEFIRRWAAFTVLHGLALPVLDVETRKSLEHRALRRHLRLGPTWGTLYSNEGTDSDDCKISIIITSYCLTAPVTIQVCID